MLYIERECPFIDTTAKTQWPSFLHSQVCELYVLIRFLIERERGVLFGIYLYMLINGCYPHILCKYHTSHKILFPEIFLLFYRITSGKKSWEKIRILHLSVPRKNIQVLIKPLIKKTFFTCSWRVQKSVCFISVTLMVCVSLFTVQ